MFPDLSLAHAAAAAREFSYQEEAATAREFAELLTEVRNNCGILPSFYLHFIHNGGYIAERTDGSWCTKALAMERDADIDRVRIVSPRVLYVRTLRELDPERLRDLIEFAYLPF